MRVHRDWKLDTGTPDGPVYDDTEARRRWDAGETVSVLDGPDDAGPATVLTADHGGRIVSVHHLDGHLRPELTNVFTYFPENPQWPGRGLPAGFALLEESHLWLFDPATDDRTSLVGRETYRFSADGTVTVRTEGPDGEQEGGTTIPRSDVQREPVLQFGHWDGYLRRDRAVSY